MEQSRVSFRSATLLLACIFCLVHFLLQGGAVAEANSQVFSTYGERKTDIAPATSWKAFVQSTAAAEHTRETDVARHFLWAIKRGHLTLALRILPSEPLTFRSGSIERKLAHIIVVAGEYALAQKVIRLYPTAVSGYTLCMAAYGGCLPLVKYLVESNLCKPHHTKVGYWYQWPYDFAAKGGHIHVMRYLHSLPKGDGGERLKQSQTTLHFAAKRGHLDIVRMLVDERNKPVDGEFFEYRKYNKPPILAALLHGYLEIASFLLSRGAILPKLDILKNVHQEEHQNKYNTNLGRFLMIEFLAENWGTEERPNERWEAFRKALKRTVKDNDSEMFLHLLKNCGRSFNSESSPLDSDFLGKAVQVGSTVIAEKVWELGARRDTSNCLLDTLHDNGDEMSRWLIDHGADPFIVVQPEDERIPLRIEHLMPEVLIFFLTKIKEQLDIHPEKRSATSQALSQCNEGYRCYIEDRWQSFTVPPLICAILRGLIDVARLLIEIGVDMETHGREVTNQGQTALCFCFHSITPSKREMLELLLEKGANPNPQLEGTDALSLAAESGDPDLVSIMLQHGARTDGHPLHAIFLRSATPDHKMKLKIAKMLIQHGADINKRDTLGSSPLDIFCRFLNPDDKIQAKILRFLLKNGAMVTLHTFISTFVTLPENILLLLWENFSRLSLPRLQEEEKKKALGFILIKAAFHGSLELVKVLVEVHGVDVNFTNEGGVMGCASAGDSVLMAALRTTSDPTKVVEFLLAHGAKKEITNASGATASQIAKAKAPSEVLAMLGAL